MIFKSKQETTNSTEREVIVECDCGTHSFHIKSFDDDEEYYFEIWASNFYTKQKENLCKRFVHRVKLIWYAIIGKEYLLEDIVLTDDDIINLVKNLEELKDNKQEVK